MEKFFVKGLGMVENNDENRALLIKLGFIKRPEFKKSEDTKAKVNVINTEEPSEHADSNTGRTKKRKSAE